MALDLKTLEYLYQKIEEEITLLKDISESFGLSTDEDFLLQFPDSTENLYLQPGQTFEKEISINKKLVYLSIDAPEGVLVTIYQDNNPVTFAIDEIGALEFRKGIYFGIIKVTASNNAEIEQKWSLRMIFT